MRPLPPLVALVAVCALGCLADSPVASAQDTGRAADAATEEGPAGLIAQLGSRYQTERHQAEQQLVALGETAVPSLLQALHSSSWQTRMGAYRALGRIGSKQAVQPLVTALQVIAADARAGRWHDPAPAYEICLALTRIRPAGYATIEAAASGEIAALEPLRDVAEHALVEWCRAPIMAHFAGADENGSYKGRFKELRQYGRAGTLMLLRIARQLINGRPEYRQNARMAIQALGDGDDSSLPTALQALREHYKGAGELPDDAETDLAWALYRHGSPAMLNDMIEQHERLQRPVLGNRRTDQIGTLARLYLKADRFDDAVKLYERQAKSSPEAWGVAYYNAACALSRAHRTAPALAALRKAVDGPPIRRAFAGRTLSQSYRDVEWMQEDGDLTFIRTQPRFWYLVAAICGRHRVGTTHPNHESAGELMGHLRRAAQGGHKIQLQGDYDLFFAGMQDVRPEPGEIITPDVRKLRREFESVWRSMGGTRGTARRGR